MQALDLTATKLLSAFFALPAAALLLAACDENSPHMAASSGDAAAYELDAAADASSEAIPTVLDRCNGSDCGLSRLVPQEDLEFLEDMGDGWLRLMEADWELAPSSEGYRCMTFTVPEDLMISAFFPQNPPGTHHGSFDVSPRPVGPDRVYACSAVTHGERRLQGSGAGTQAVQLPPGIGMRLRRGEQITMNLHLFNVTEQPLTGRSGMWIKTVPESQVQHEAQTILAGPLTLTAPVGRSTQTGGCTIPQDTTVFSVSPHMHQKGVHMRATVTTGGREVELYDGDYDFYHQVVHPIEAVQLKAGDVVRLECTYENDTDAPIGWGDSSLDEMCFIALSMYPADAFQGRACIS